MKTIITKEKWNDTHKDYKLVRDGKHMILMNLAGGTTLVPVNVKDITIHEEGSIQTFYNEVAEGYKMAYDTEAQQKGVVKISTGEFFPTVPLNGWRARNLAEAIYGVRDAGEWYLNRGVITSADIVKNLPGFDGQNQAIVDQFEGRVLVHVVVNDPGYGQHIKITQLSE